MFEVANTLIEERLRANWSETGIDWDNVEFTPSRGTPFVRLDIQWTGNNTISIGGRNRGEGYIDISVFVPSNTGTTAVSGIADRLAAIFNKWDTGQLKFRVARTQRVGEQEQWYQVKVLVPFQFDECN